VILRLLVYPHIKAPARVARIDVFTELPERRKARRPVQAQRAFTW
jgi:hypothetical protein